MSGLANRLTTAREALRTSLWPLPVIALVVSVVAGVGLPRVDAHVDASIPAWLATPLFGGGTEAARKLLGAIASSLITATSLTFSLTVVTLQLASSQFSPRLLRTFTRDRMVHSTLALFLATFTYALTVLRSVRSADEGAAFVPQLAVTLAYVLTLVSVVMLVLFLAHLASEIRVESLLRSVHREAGGTVERLMGAGGPVVGDPGAEALLERRAGDRPLLAASSGFLVSVDEEGLLAAAAAAGAVVVVRAQPGSSVVAGTPLGWVRRDGGDGEGGGDGAPVAPLAEQDRAELERCVREAVVIGFERTAVQDVAFGLRQLTDVANKALSPGINDPTTAVHALGHSSALLCQLAGRHPGPRVLRHVREGEDPGRGTGPVAVVLARPTMAELLELAVAQPRHYGAADALVVGRLHQLLEEVAFAGGPSVAGAVRTQLRRLRATAGEQGFDAEESERLEALAASVERTAAGVL